MVEQLGLDVEIRAQMDRFDRNMRAAGRLVDTTVSGMDKSTKRAQQAFNRLDGALDPAARAALRLERDTAKVQRALDKGAISADRAAQVQRRLNDQYEQAVSRLSSMGVAQQQSVARVNALNTAQGASALMSGRMGNAVQQAGYQVGDFAVQVASGQGVLRPFIQQGTQLVSMFGPWGAVIGAAGAVVGALATTFITADDEAGELEMTIADLAAEARNATGDFDALREKIEELSGAGRGLLAIEAATQLLELREVLPEINQNLTGIGSAFARLGDAANGANLDAFSEKYGVLAGDIRDLAAAGAQLNQNSTADEIQAVGDAVADFVSKSAENIGPMADSLRGLLTRLQEAGTAKESIELLKGVLDGLGGTLANNGSRSVAASTKKAGDAFGDLEDQVREARGALDAFQQGGAEDLERYQQYAEELDLAARAFEKYKDEVNDGSKTFEDFRVLAQELGQATRDLSDEQEDAAEAARRFKESQDEAAKAAEKAAREYEKVWDNAIENVQDTLKDGIRDALDGNLRSVQDWSRAFLNIIKDLAANLLAQQFVIPVVSSGASALGIPGAPGGGGINFSSIGSLLTGGTTPGGYSLIGAGGGTLGNAFLQSSWAQSLGLATGPLSGIGPALPSATGNFIGTGLNNLSNPLNGPAGFAGNFIGSQLFEQSTGSSIGGTLGGIIGGMTPLGPVGAFLGAMAGNFIGGMFGTNPASVGPTGVAITGNVLNPTLDDMATGTDNGGDARAAVQALEAISDAAIKIEDDLTGAIRKSSVFGLDVSYFPNPEPGSDGDKSAGFGLNEIIDGVKRELDINGLTGEEVLFEGVIRTLRGAFETLGDGRLDTALENTAAESIEELLEDLNIAKTISDHMNSTVEAPLTAVELQFEALTDRAEEFEKKAVALGLSLQEAELVTESWTQALSDSVADDFETRINASTGNGFLNTVGDLIEQRNIDGRNAVAAGLDVDGTAGVLFRNLLGGFVDDLNQAQRNLIRSSFSDDQGVLDVLDRADAESAVALSLKAVNDNMRDRIDLLDDERNELERLADVAGNLGANLRNAANGLLTNQNLSPLSLEEQLAEARRQTEAAFAIANDNTPMDDASIAAAGRLPDLVRTTLELSRAFNASNEDYLDDFTRGQEILNSTADRALSIEAQQLSAMQSIDQEIQLLNQQLAANENSAAYVMGGDGQYVTTGANNVAAGIDLGYNPAAALQIYQALAAAGIWISGFGEGQLNQLRQTNAQANQIVSQLGFAEGGVIAGGIPGVDSVPFLGMPGERILTGEQNRIFERLESGDGGHAVASEIRALSREVAGLRSDNARLQSQLVRVTAGGSLEVTKAVQEGNSQRGRMLDDRMVDRAAPMPRKVA
jgi:hypothetical protein